MSMDTNTIEVTVIDDSDLAGWLAGWRNPLGRSQHDNTNLKKNAGTK